MPRGTFYLEVRMTDEDKKTYIWTVGIVGLMAILVAVALASGIIPTA